MAINITRRAFLRNAVLLGFAAPFIRPFRGISTNPGPIGEDAELCVKKFSYAVDNKLTGQPIGDLVASIGGTFIGTDYEAGVLDAGTVEHLIVHLSGFDCVTLCENALAFARCIKLRTMTYDSYCDQLRFIRYRGGVIDGYPSRLHYFSDWIYDNVKKRAVEDCTAEVGGRETLSVTRTIDFMSGHRGSYVHLADENFFDAIRRREEEISARPFRYIPKDAVKSVSQNIRNGDILAITTSIAGMDVSHTGIAVLPGDGTVQLLHAPVPGTKVRMTEMPLWDYLAKNSRQTGIIVARPLEPQ